MFTFGDKVDYRHYEGVDVTTTPIYTPLFSLSLSLSLFTCTVGGWKFQFIDNPEESARDAE